MAKPFVKWVGGKRQLLQEILPRIPESHGRYIEPMVGGGAVFFALEPREAILMDSNKELIEAYRMVRDHLEDLIECLQEYENDEATYYAVRAEDPTKFSPIQRSARLIYLLKTGFNGLYRVNRKGQFNTPYGHYKNPNIVNAEGLREASKALQNTTLIAGDFEQTLGIAKAGDFLYIDPPYCPISKTANFTSYTADAFTYKDHERLKATVDELQERGCHVLLSNADTPLVRDLYHDYDLIEVSAKRNISASVKGRANVQELLIATQAIGVSDMQLSS